MSPDTFIAILKIVGLFIGISFLVFWVGLVWWVAQDVLSRTSDKIIIAAAVAITAILGPVGILLYLIVRPRQTINESYSEMVERDMLLNAAASTICPTCNHMAQEDFLSCPYCGTQLKQHCPNCDRLVDINWAHCPFCGVQLSASSDSITTTQPDSFVDDQPEVEMIIETAPHRNKAVDLFKRLANSLSQATDLRELPEDETVEAMAIVETADISQPTAESVDLVLPVNPDVSISKTRKTTAKTSAASKSRGTKPKAAATSKPATTKSSSGKDHPASAKRR